MLAIDHSPYQGVAVPFVGAYDDQVHTYQDYADSIHLLNAHKEKDVWPWIFWNRVVGTDLETLASHPDSPANKAYFNQIQGMDIYDQHGALSDFYAIYRNALKSAKSLHSPGIVIDMEVYNNYYLYNTETLARQLNKNKAEVEQRLQEIGKKLTDIANEEYPEAVLWFLFTGLGESGPDRVINPESRTITQVVLGMLEEAKSSNAKLQFVAGGEVGAGYCYLSYDHLKDRLSDRNRNFKSVLKEFPNLVMGATLAPWDGSSPRSGWMTEEKCGASQFSGVNDFKPVFKHLFSQYRYVWIYAAEEAPYNPYNPQEASSYNQAISETQEALYAEAFPTTGVVSGDALIVPPSSFLPTQDTFFSALNNLH